MLYKEQLTLTKISTDLPKKIGNFNFKYINEMTTEEINKMVQKEYMDYNNAIYSGNPALPKDIMETFKKAVFHSNPTVHKIPTGVIKKIISKKLKDLTNIDVPIILNVISAANFCDLYKDLDEALEKNYDVEEIKMAINLTVAEINRKTEEKRNNLLTLSGGGSGKIKTLAQA